MSEDGAIRRATDRAADDQRRPLYRQPSPPTEFPKPALCDLLSVAECIRALTMAPFELCAQSVLATSALAFQPYFDVDVPRIGRRPLSSFFVSVAVSGERKTSVDRYATSPAVEAEKLLADQSRMHAMRHQNDVEVWQLQRDKIKREQKNQGMDRLREALEMLGPRPDPLWRATCLSTTSRRTS
jgi:Protein of unknown function (DUF3987)